MCPYTHTTSLWTRQTTDKTLVHHSVKQHANMCTQAAKVHAELFQLPHDKYFRIIAALDIRLCIGDNSQAIIYMDIPKNFITLVVFRKTTGLS